MMFWSIGTMWLGERDQARAWRASPRARAAAGSRAATSEPSTSISTMIVSGIEIARPCASCR